MLGPSLAAAALGGLFDHPASVMPLIWCSISGHGFGHAAQVVPVLNALSKRVPGLRAILRTTVPSWFFDNRLELPWEISLAEQDIGCIQQDPLTMDYPETWARHLRFQTQWQNRLEEEVQAMRARQPALVLSNISWLAVAAGAKLQLPCVAMCNLSWDQILEPEADPANQEHAALLTQIREGYSHARVMVRLAPGLPMVAFPSVIDVGPVAQNGSTPSLSLHELLNVPTGERIVLVGFGGIALQGLPFERMEQMAGYQFLISGAVPDGLRRCHAAASLSAPFPQLLTSADIIMTKPGYSTIVEAIARDRPVLYVRRYNFADEEPMVQYLHRYGRGVELSAKDFAKGSWEEALRALDSTLRPSRLPPAPTGAIEAATILTTFL